MNTATRIAALQQKIQLLRSEGEVAAPNTWISSFVVPKPNGKRYTYYRLMSASPKRRNRKKTAVMKCYLGNARSAKYKRALAAIERRNQIQAIERSIKRLEALALKEEKVLAAAEFDKVSGGNENTDISKLPPLTKRSTDRKWQHLQQQLKQLNENCQQLTESINEERAFRALLLKEIEALKAVVGKKESYL